MHVLQRIAGDGKVSIVCVGRRSTNGRLLDELGVREVETDGRVLQKNIIKKVVKKCDRETEMTEGNEKNVKMKENVINKVQYKN